MLTPALRATVRALGDTLLPSIAEGDPPGGDVVPDSLDDLMRHLPPKKQRELRVVLTVFDLAAVPLHGRRFARLPPEKRDRYVDGWMRSRIPARRIVFRSLRTLFATLYYQDDRSWKTLGYDGPVVKRDRAKMAVAS
jgi:hypothetical protein